MTIEQHPQEKSLLSQLDEMAVDAAMGVSERLVNQFLSGVALAENTYRDSSIDVTYLRVIGETGIRRLMEQSENKVNNTGMTLDELLEDIGGHYGTE